jgi:CRISPR-associated protein Csm1
MFDQSNPVDDKADISKITSADISRVKRINDTNFLATSLKGQRVSYGFQFYGGNKQAEFNDKRDKTFEDLTRVEKEGITTETYFGVLRMDVDGLGVIFIKGLSETNKTFSAYATLSSSLDWFFSGYLNTIREKYKDNVNILYSGGDDVFAVGRWDLLLSFAEDIRNGFRKYVGREDISISAGINIVGNKYPIAKAAQLAGEALDEAKKCGEEKAKKIPAKKNAINFLGQTVSWEEEFDWVKLKKTEFVCLINNGKGMSKGILHRIMLFAEIQANNKLHQGKTDKNGKLFVPDLSYYWNSAYYLKRFMEGKTMK